MTSIDRLIAQVQAACPGCDLSIGRRGDSATVRLTLPPASTQPQQTAAQAVVDSFAWNDAAAQQAWEDSLQPERTTLRQAAAQAVADIDTFLALASPTNAQTLAQVKRHAQILRAVIRRLI